MIEELKEAGYCYQCTNPDDLSLLLNNEKITFYIGFDCTGRSLHVGHLVAIMLVRLLQKKGHQPILLIGSATSKIGDPSGKTKERQLISDEEIEKNIEGIKKSLGKFIDFGNEGKSAIIVKNHEWLNGIRYLEFLQEYGRHISINKLIELDIFKSRLDQQKNLSLLEFNYPFLQAYDFLYLYKKYKCILQIGGSDQWGNITTGAHLGKKLFNQELFGLTIPLITTSDGKKMGKSEKGAKWLNEDMMSPYEYFQYWRNIKDDDIEKFTKLYAEYDAEQLNYIINLSKSDINKTKEALAYRLTDLCHGKEAAGQALKSAISIFYDKQLSNNLVALPEVEIENAEILNGIKLQYLLTKSKLSDSNLSSKRLIQNKCCRVNGKMLDDPYFKITEKDFTDSVLNISVGRKRFCRLILKHKL